MDMIEIEIMVFDNERLVSRAEASSPENAIYAARILTREYRKSYPYQGKKMIARFYVDGEMVREVAEDRLG